MPIERTTLAAERDDLALLRAEASRRGVSLSGLLRDLVAREADHLRSRRRPRFGLGHSGTGAAKAAAERPDEPFVAQPYRP